jgi:hypothetical protein
VIHNFLQSVRLLADGMAVSTTIAPLASSRTASAWPNWWSAP